MALQNCCIENINTYLQGVYFIPAYQREYSWEQNELEDFWKDLFYTKNTADKDFKHFFGQIVIYNDETSSKKFIIDGQQRTITSIIFARSLQLMYKELYMDYGINAANTKVVIISQNLIGPYDEEEKKPHLNLGESDSEYFIKNIIVGIPSGEKTDKKSTDRMRRAFQYFYNNLKEEVDQCEDKQDKFNTVNSYYETFTTRFNIMYMEATKLEEAFIIFETLNARGKDLETSDLLKNYIFSKSNNSIFAQTQWNKMLESLDKSDPTKYIRHFWNSQHKFTREKELYREISREILSPRDSKKLLENLCKNAQLYHDISNPEDNINLTDDRLINSLTALKTLKAKTFYPVLLAMNQSEKKFSESDRRKVVEGIEAMIFRNFTICKNVANSAEVLFAGIAKKIYDGEYTTVDEILSAIKEKTISDKEFAGMFESWKGNSSSKNVIRYIFKKIHNSIDTNLELNIDSSEVHIEHIMPQKVSSQWNVSSDIHDEYLWRLGNICLLSGKINIKISNKPFDEKKYRYKESKIEPNPQIAEFEKWGAEEIEARQNDLAKIAVKIWK